jgi:hypothetical protein
MAAVAVLSGLGQPLRRINYGFWPVLSSPVALLLPDTNGTIGWLEALERSTHNATGALLAHLARARGTADSRLRCGRPPAASAPCSP